jgi:hypothetical protein
MFMYVHVVEVLGAGLIREDGPVFLYASDGPIAVIVGGYRAAMGDGNNLTG